MSKFCIICGSEIFEGKCPNAESHFKKMCLNCTSCNDTDGNCSCHNEDNLNDAIEKMKQSVPSGYAVESIQLKPIPLKDPTKKCKRWALNVDAIVAEYENLAQ